MQKHGFELSDATHGLTRPGIVNPRGFHQVQNKKRCLVLPIPMPAVEDTVEMAGELVVVEEAAAEAEVLMLPFQGKHQRLEPART
jgi:hypothetical protein